MRTRDGPDPEGSVRGILRLAPVLLCAALTACAGVPGVRPSVRNVEARVQRIHLDGVEMEFDITIGNPLLSALHSPRYTFSLDAAGRTLATGRAAAGADFPAAGVGTVTIPVRVGYDLLAAAYGDLDGLSEAPYELRGSVMVPMLGSTVDVPFAHIGSFPIVRAPMVEIVDVDTSLLTDTGGDFYVKVRLRNPNRFPVTLDDVGYSLELGGLGFADLGAVFVSARPLRAGEIRTAQLSGNLTLAQAAQRLLGIRGLSGVTVSPTGTVGTPYGPLQLSD